ncbi:MAG: sensor histidine kinase [Chitinophagaceae bacterium]
MKKTLMLVSGDLYKGKKRIVNYIRKTTGLYILVMLSNTMYAQTLMNKDSLLRLLPVAKEDTNAVLLYNTIGEQYEGSELETAKQYYRKAGELSKKIGYKKGVIAYINNYTFMLNTQGSYDSSVLLNLQAVELSKKSNDSLGLGKSLFNTGTSYRLLGDFENAVIYYQEGKMILERLGRKELESKLNDILQVLYYDMKQYDKGVEYGEKAVLEFRKMNDTIWLGTALNNLGINYSSLRRYDKSTLLFKEALEIARLIDDKLMQTRIFINLGDGQLQLREFEKMKYYYGRALLLSKEMEMHETEVMAIMGMSYYFKYKKQYDSAGEYAKRALALSYQFNLRTLREKIFTQLSNLAYIGQNILLGEDYAKQGQLLGDSMLNESIQKKTLSLEKKYETEKKELQISKLEAEKKGQQLSIRQKSTLNYFLVGSVAALLIVVFLGYRNLRNRRQLASQQSEIQQQRIRELEKDKKLVAVDSMLKGQEEERSRLAKDLHDGLGGLLSGVKFSLSNMKDNLIVTPDNMAVFERSLDMIDTSIRELRRVAQNMMPEMLTKFGLDEALKDYCNTINATKLITVRYQSHGQLSGIDKSAEIIIYRIIQELLNNTMKHAGATEAFVQLIKEDSRLSVVVEDNGKGFDADLLENNKGAGWTNIRSRVEYLRGRLDLHSEKGKGTLVNIEFSI